MFLTYIVNNFALLCISIAMFFIIIYNIHGQKKQNIYSGAKLQMLVELQLAQV